MKVGAGAPPRALALKVCLAGDYAVGKTSLVRRFVSNTFSDDYIATLGAKVASKHFPLPDPLKAGAERQVNLTLWDLMGQRGFRDMLQEAFFLNARGVLYVADATRPETLYSLVEWHSSVAPVAGPIPGIVLLNKTDLEGQIRISTEEVARFCGEQGWPWIPTSAKTGTGVEEAFRRVGEACLRDLAVPATSADAH